VVTAQIINIDSANHRLGLSLRQAGEAQGQQEQEEENSVRSDNFYFAEPPISEYGA